MVNKQLLRNFRAALSETDKPLEPLDKKYVPGLHGTDAEDVMGRLREDILSRPELSTQLFYFTGQRGTGKSTELMRLESDLQGEGALVVRFDSLNYISETELITLETVLLLVVAGIASWAAEQNYKADFLKDNAWTRFAQWLQTEVELTEVGIEGLKFKLKEQQASISERLAKTTSAVQHLTKLGQFAGEMVEFIRKATHRNRVVVIVDSLERLRGATSEAQDKMFGAVVQAFASDVTRLRITGATLVYAIPPYLPLLANIRNDVDCHALGSVRMYQKPPRLGGPKPGRQIRQEGVALMRSLLDKRFENWRAVLSEAAVDQMALKSGGDLRHFLRRLVYEAVSRSDYAIDRWPLTAEDEIVVQVLAKNADETLELTVREEWPLLKKVTYNSDALAENRDSSLRTLARLLEMRVILNYQNGSQWYDIHPLLWSVIDAFEPAATHADNSGNSSDTAANTA